MSAIIYKQYKMQTGQDQVIVWLGWERLLRIGETIHLIGVHTEWTILEVYDRIEHDRTRSTWRVGGLVPERER